MLREHRSSILAVIEQNAGWDAAKKIVDTRFEYQQTGKLPLPLLFWRFRKQKAQPRDKIFGLLGLCKRQDSMPIYINCSLNVDEVARQCAMWIMKTYVTLDLLSIRSAWSLDEYSASWQACSWSFPLPQELLDRQPLSPGIFDGRHSFGIYSASGADTHPIFNISEKQSFMNVCGIRFDEIVEILGPSVVDVGLAELCRQIDCAQSRLVEPKQKTIEAKWRTLVADQWPIGTRLGTSTAQGVKIPPETEDEEKKILGVINLQCQIPQLEGRQVIVTSGGRLGLALEEVQVGDSIVLLPGGALPYVLRPYDNGWMFSGECYVHDCMDGQIVNTASQVGKEWWTETFHVI